MSHRMRKALCSAKDNALSRQPATIKKGEREREKERKRETVFCFVITARALDRARRWTGRARWRRRSLNITMKLFQSPSELECVRLHRAVGRIGPWPELDAADPEKPEPEPRKRHSKKQTL